MMSPPTTAPGTLSRPPRMTAGKTLSPIRASWVSTPSMLPHMTPPMAAVSPSMAHESANTRRTLMPTAIAACWSLATARMTIPPASAEEPCEGDQEGARDEGREQVDGRDVDLPDHVRLEGDRERDVLGLCAPEHGRRSLEDLGEPDGDHDHRD